ncbi:MAG TPA: capsule assembly Wzi family protein, partial [Steroidobacteraceae bacterium]|nr:capsule assembly Wzi family protein [Steroidobacteraceae bacterium]
MNFAARAAPLALFACLAMARAQAGASAYLPVDLAPELEARVERVMTLAGVPVMTRPIRVDAVLGALPLMCDRYPRLCHQVRAGLAPYLAAAAVTHAHAELAATRDNALVQPDQHGAPMNTAWEADAGALARFGEHLLVTAGGVGYEGRLTPTGTMISLGGDRAQLDLGYRDHWWSPLRLSSMLTSTEAPTLPSATLSSAAPLTRLNLRYEVFLGEMSYSQRIEYHDGFTAGHPELFGFHVDIELAPGWSLGASRLMQFGGGARPHSWGALWRAFVNTTRYDNTSTQLNTDQEFGNQQFAVSSTLALPLRMPMSLYIEYAAEDTFHVENTRFGSSAVSAGFYLPQLRPDLQLRYEFSEWQSNWYVHHIYRDGMTNDGVVLGNWAAAWRLSGDGVGAQSHALELIWDRRNGRQYDFQYRTALNGSYGDAHYQRVHEVALGASRPWRSWRVGAKLDGGRDEYGEGFGRVAAYASYTGLRAAAASSVDEADEAPASRESGYEPEAARHQVEGFVDLGVFASRMDFEQDAGKVPAVTTSQSSAHLGLGVRRAFDRHNDFGARIELDNVQGHLFTALRAVDYRRRIGPKFAAAFFLGVGRYEGPTPAYGWYGGLGAQWRDIRSKWDLSLDARIGDHMVRNKIPGEPIILWPNTFYSIYGA